MPVFFAEFRDMGGFWIRHNTRIYLEEFNGSLPVGECLGAIVAKNPGSAKPDGAGWRPLLLDRDKMLPNVRNILLKAFAGKMPPANAYFQVLNLFYICGSHLGEATKTWVQYNHKSDLDDPAESDSFPVVWFAWGGNSGKLNPLKDRFLTAPCEKTAFFYSPATRSIVARPPTLTELAKHPLRMPHEPVVSHLASIFKARQQ